MPAPVRRKCGASGILSLVSALSNLHLLDTKSLALPE